MTAKLGMADLANGAGNQLLANANFELLGQLVQAAVLDKDLSTPPGSPANGALYIVAAAATGAWAGQSGKLAFWLASASAWTFAAPVNGWRVWVADESIWYQYSGSAWVADDTAWASLTLTNAWAVSGGLTPQWKRVKGVVYLRGKCENPTFVSNGTAAFTLEAGSRPGQTGSFATLGGATDVTAAKASITTGGVASLTDLVTASGTVHVNLNGIAFAI